MKNFSIERTARFLSKKIIFKTVFSTLLSFYPSKESEKKRKEKEL